MQLSNKNLEHKKDIIAIREKLEKTLHCLGVILSEDIDPLMEEIYSILGKCCSNVIEVINEIFFICVSLSFYGLFATHKKRIRDINNVTKAIEKFKKAVSLFESQCFGNMMSRYILSAKDENEEKLGIINHYILDIRKMIEDMYKLIETERSFASFRSKKEGYEKVALQIGLILRRNGIVLKSTRGGIFEQVLAFVFNKLMKVSGYKTHDDTIHKIACYALREANKHYPVK